jgi:hypothetical protein
MQKRKQPKVFFFPPSSRIVVIRAKAIFTILLALDAMHYALDARSPLAPAALVPIALGVDGVVLFLAARWLLRTLRPDDPCFQNAVPRLQVVNLLLPLLPAVIIVAVTEVFAPPPLFVDHGRHAAHGQHAQHVHHIRHDHHARS